MNLSSIIALIIILILVITASVYLHRHGTCGACPDAGNCKGHCNKDYKKDPDYKDKLHLIDDIIKKCQSIYDQNVTEITKKYENLSESIDNIEKKFGKNSIKTGFI